MGGDNIVYGYNAILNFEAAINQTEFDFQKLKTFFFFLECLENLQLKSLQNIAKHSDKSSKYHLTFVETPVEERR